MKSLNNGSMKQLNCLKLINNNCSYNLNNMQIALDNHFNKSTYL